MMAELERRFSRQWFWFCVVMAVAGSIPLVAFIARHWWYGVPAFAIWTVAPLVAASRLFDRAYGASPSSEGGAK